jgi:hypothetical protein
VLNPEPKGKSRNAQRTKDTTNLTISATPFLDENKGSDREHLQHRQ